MNIYEFKRRPVTALEATNGKICVYDLAKHLGEMIGRVAYIEDSGWVGIMDKNGRIDEYRIEYLERA